MMELVKFEQSNLIKETLKEGLKNIVSQYLERVAFEGGDVDGDYALCEKYIYILSEIKDGLKPYVEKEVNLYENSTEVKFGVTLQAVDTTKYDYSNNEEWVAQKSIVDQEAGKLKKIEAFIKTLSGIITTVDTETGETKTFAPPVKMSNRTIRATIK